MMCSSWKISVFGIVALMLAFGLTAGDAFAHSDGHSDHPTNIVQHFTDATLSVRAISTETLDPRAANGNGDGRKDRDADLRTADPEDRLKATEVLDALVFTYVAGRTPVKGKAITITIPSGWTPATKDVDDGVNRAGEVELYVAGVLKRDKLIVTSRTMKFTGIDPALNAGDAVQFWFKRVKVPVRADTYEFGVISEMTGAKHVNKLNPHLEAHATQLDADTDDPNAHDHGRVGTITLVVDEHTHPDDATHQHVDDVNLVDPPPGHSSHTTDHTHGGDKNTVVEVEGHTHPFSDGFQPHKHDADNGTVYTSKAGDADLHTHTTGSQAPFKDTHAHDEDGNVVTEPHGIDTGENQHTHDTDKSVAGVTSHKHPAGSILDHAHATDGRRGIGALSTTDHEAPANVHTHASSGRVDPKTHTHSGHNGDHGHVGTAAASLPTDHNTNTHYHVSEGGEVAGVSGHRHTNSNDDLVFVGHAHDGVNIADVTTHDTNIHMHRSNGLIVDVGRGHTHSTAANRRGYTRTHQHSSDGTAPGASTSAVERLDEDDEHTATAAGHTPFYFRSGNGSDVDLPVHTHSGSAVTWPEATDTGWDGIAAGRFGDYNIPYHTHDGSGRVVVVTAHTHGDDDDGTPEDEVITVSITDHMHQTGVDATDTDSLEHSGEDANDVVDAAEHTHGAGSAVTIDVLAHKHQTGSDATVVNSLTHPDGAANDMAVITSQHTHGAGTTVIVVTAHTHQTGDDATTSATDPLSHPGEDAATDIMVVTAHYHGASEAVEPLVSAHSHEGDGHTADNLRSFGAHTHDTAVTAHKHDDEAEFTVTEVKAHTHTSSRGPVRDVSNHIHPGGDASPRIEGVDPTEKHVHAILHNSKYAVRVGPVPSGSGTLALSNTGSAVRIAARTADPYKGNYVVTKGQDLGDLMLTFTAAGTMVAGAGIRIQLPDPNPAFPSFYRDNNAPGPPGGGGVRLTRGNVELSADPVNGDSDGISSDALYFKTKSKLQHGDRFTVRIRDVMTNPHGGDPGQDPTETVADYAFAASTASPSVSPNADNPIGSADLVSVEKPPVVTITGQHGVGELTLEARDPRDTLTQATTGDEDLGDVVLTYKAVQPMGKKSQVEITIHSAWPDHPYPPADSSDERAGGVFVDIGSLAINGRVLTATLDDGLDVGETLSFTYRTAKAPATEGSYEFTAKSKAGPHGTLKPLPADKQKKVDVTTGHGSGTVSLRRGGTTFRETDKEVALGTLVFTYTAAGRMAKDSLVRVTIPQEWTAPAYDNGDSRAAGVVMLGGTGKADLEITGGGSSPWYLIAKLSEPMTKNQTLVFTYRNVTAPAAAGSYAFTTSATAFPGALDIDDPGAELQSGSPEVGVEQAPDGSGTITVASTTATLGQDTTGAYLVNAGQPLDNLGFTYTATGKMESGAVVSITVPSEAGWDQPTYSNTEVSAGVELGIGDDTATATLQSALEKGDTFTITYKGITAPSSAGRSVFTTQSQSTSAGELKDLTVGSPTFVVGDVPVGNLVITTADGELTSAGPDMALGDVTLTFTATAPMSAGATVNITIPAGWSIPGEDNNDGVDREGEVVLSSVPADVADFRVSGGGAQPWQLVATTDAALATGDTLVFTYKMVTTPSTPKSYDFTTTAAASATSDPIPIVQQPSTIIVRAVVSAIAIKAEDSFFAGDSLSGMVTLWSGTAAANALGAMDIYLSTSSETGSFAADMITIGDNMPGAAFTYMDTAPGVVTLTASTMMPAADDAADTAATNGADMAADTSGALMATKTVTVKSGVAGLSVTPDLVKAGSDVTVTATGKVGGGTVSVMDAEGTQVGATKALDPVGDADEDGNQAYSRTVTLPADLADGTYTVTVDIQGLTRDEDIEVLNDQSAPTLSEASAWPSVVADGGQAALRVSVAPNESMVEITSVTADVSALDSTRKEPISLSAQPDEEGVYTRLFTISTNNTNDDGMVMVSFTATDRVGNVSEAATASITLRNDVTAPMLSMATAMPSPAANGTMVTISVSSESGLTVMADASAIGGAAAVALAEGMMAADGMTNGNGANGMTNGNGANGMTNGNGANGMTNGNGANGMTNGNGANGMTNGNGANGMTNGNGAIGMDAGAMPAGNGMYSGMATVTGAADGEQMITITATDASGNSSTATVSVMIDNTGPMLSMANADPAMATNGTMVTISVSTESGATVMADASAIGGDAALALAEGMDENMAGTGMYSAMVTVASATDGAQMVSITATDALGNASEAGSATVTVDNTAPTLADAAVTPDWALNGDTVAISVNGGESGLTVMADASAIGGDAATALAEGMDADMAGTGMYSADVTVAGAMGGDQMVSISASDAHGNASEAVSASVSIHVVTSASFSPADVSTGDTVMVSAMGTAGLAATFNVFNAEGTNIVTEGMLTESADAAGSYSGSFDVVVDAHPTGTYWVSVNVGQASMTAEGALTIDHLAQFDLMIGAGTHLIHVPLDVTQIDGVAGTIDTVGDLYDALGDAVNFIISLSADGSWNSYLGDSSAGGVADAAIGDDTGLIAVMSSAATLQLAGNALGTGGTATISLSAGNNLVGVPLDGDPSLNMISDALASPAITAVVVSNAAGNGFNIIKRAGDPGDGAIMGGVGYIVVSAAMGSVPVVGMAWDNSGMMEDASATVAMNGGTAANGNGASTAPSIGFQTPVLQVQGKLIDQAGMMSREGLNVTVKNLTSGGVLGRTTATDDYSMTFVKLDSSAAKVGDVIEIKADSPNPLLGIRPVQHVVTAEDVLDSRISLPDLVTYEIPAQTELLANYPNPFNPETWIPYRLAEDARVSLTIYGASGSLVRTIDIGFTPAAVYQGRSEAIYWDGRNDFGEQVSSGIYFYHLNAGDFSATRKMVIVK